jgi:6-phosphogluconate dehydrogenase (decarboxylating)
MEIAFMGLGKMGLNMVTRIQSFAEAMLAAMRNAFGGHAVKR